MKLPLDRVLVGDTVAEMKKLPPCSVDVIFADPPYNLQLEGELHRPNNTKVDGVDDAWAPAIWQTFFTSTLGLEVPVLSSLPRHHNLPAAKCGCKKFLLDTHGDHISTCTAHSGATKAHDWMVGRLGPLFRTAGHRVRTQHGVSTSAEGRQKRGDVEILNYLQDAAGSRNLVFDLAVTHA